MGNARSEVSRRIARWFVFSLCISIAPLVLRYLGLKIFGVYAGLDQVLGDGGLLLIATAVCADTFGETFSIKNSERASVFMIMLAGGSFLTSIVSSMLWATFALSIQIKINTAINVQTLMWLSIVISIIAVVLGLLTRIKLADHAAKSDEGRATTPPQGAAPPQKAAS